MPAAARLVPTLYQHCRAGGLGEDAYGPLRILVQPREHEIVKLLSRDSRRAGREVRESRGVGGKSGCAQTCDASTVPGRDPL